MMPPLLLDIGWTELMVIGVVALIVVGPKDLPQMFRKVGQFVGKARGMAREFQRAMEDAADETGVKDIGNSIKKATDVGDLGLDDVASSMKDYSNNYVPGFGSKSAGAAKEAAKGSVKTASKTKAKVATKTAAAKATAKKATKAKSATATAAKTKATPKPKAKAAPKAAAKKMPAKKSNS